MEKWINLINILPKDEEYVETEISAYLIGRFNVDDIVPAHIQEFTIIKANCNYVILLRKSSKISIKSARKLRPWSNSAHHGGDIIIQYVKEMFEDDWHDNLKEATKQISVFKKRQIKSIKYNINRIKEDLNKQLKILKLFK